MVGIFDIFHVQLPVIVHELAVGAQDTNRPVKHAGDVRGHARAEPLREGRDMGGEGGKHQPV